MVTHKHTHPTLFLEYWGWDRAEVFIPNIQELTWQGTLSHLENWERRCVCLVAAGSEDVPGFPVRGQNSRADAGHPEKYSNILTTSPAIPG